MNILVHNHLQRVVQSQVALILGYLLWVNLGDQSLDGIYCFSYYYSILQDIGLKALVVLLWVPLYTDRANAGIDLFLYCFSVVETFLLRSNHIMLSHIDPTRLRVQNNDISCDHCGCSFGFVKFGRHAGIDHVLLCLSVVGSFLLRSSRLFKRLRIQNYNISH
jgi:hypothetical protein